MSEIQRRVPWTLAEADRRLHQVDSSAKDIEIINAKIKEYKDRIIHQEVELVMVKSDIVEIQNKISVIDRQIQDLVDEASTNSIIMIVIGVILVITAIHQFIV